MGLLLPFDEFIIHTRVFNDEKLDVAGDGVVEGLGEGVEDGEAGLDLGDHGDVGDAGRGERGEDLVDGPEGRVGGQDHRLAVAVAPHERLVGRLGDHGRDVAVVDGRDVHDATQLLRHSSRRATVGLVACTKLKREIIHPVLYNDIYLK